MGGACTTSTYYVLAVCALLHTYPPTCASLSGTAVLSSFFFLAGRLILAITVGGQEGKRAILIFTSFACLLRKLLHSLFMKLFVIFCLAHTLSHSFSLYLKLLSLYCRFCGKGDVERAVRRQSCVWVFFKHYYPQKRVGGEVRPNSKPTPSTTKFFYSISLVRE